MEQSIHKLYKDDKVEDVIFNTIGIFIKALKENHPAHVMTHGMFDRGVKMVDVMMSLTIAFKLVEDEKLSAHNLKAKKIILKNFGHLVKDFDLESYKKVVEA